MAWPGVQNNQETDPTRALATDTSFLLWYKRDGFTTGSGLRCQTLPAQVEPQIDPGALSLQACPRGQEARGNPTKTARPKGLCPAARRAASASIYMLRKGTGLAPEESTDFPPGRGQD